MNLHFVKATLSPVWNLFVSKDIPDEAPASVTSMIDSYTLPSGEVLSPVKLSLEGEHVDFHKALGHSVPVMTCGLMVGVITAEEDGTVIYGAGADWWWTCYVNGEKVFGRPRDLQNGNVRSTFMKTDWIFPIKVHKGENIVAFHLISGSCWSLGTGLIPIDGELANTIVADDGCIGLPSGETGLRLICNTTRNPLSYKVGEDMEFLFELKDPRAVSSGRLLLLVWNKRGDDGCSASGITPISLEKPVSVHVSATRPGFVHISAFITPILCEPQSDPLLQFEGGAGADIDKLAPAASRPDDFDAYWAAQRARLDAVPLKPEVEQYVGCVFPDGVAIPPSLDIFKVKVPCAGPNPVTGLLAVPKEKGKYPVRVIFDGYSKDPKRSHRLMTPGMITFHVNAHGYDLFRAQPYYDEFFRPFEKNYPSYGLAPEENKDPDTAYFNGMALRVMRSFDFVKTLPEWNGRDLIAEGGSQGGLQSVWAASLVEGLTRCETSITWCSNIAGAQLDGRLPGWHPEYVRGLDYYDTVFHASRIPESCFVDFERIGLGDYTCPPSGVTMVYNAIRGRKRAAYYQNSTHMYVPPEPAITRVHA